MTIKILIPYNFTLNDEKSIEFVGQRYRGKADVNITLFHGYAPVPEIDVKNNPIMEKMKANVSYLRMQQEEQRQALEDAIVESARAGQEGPSKAEPGRILDLDALIRTLNHDTALVGECFDAFLTTTPPLLEKIEDKIRNRTFDAVPGHLETFRDTAKLLSCKGVMDTAFTLERACLGGREDDIPGAFSALAAVCDELTTFIHTYSVKDLFIKCLLVQEDFESRKRSHELLSQYGFCDMAANGLEALNAFVRAHKQGDSYRLILLDADMKEFDGAMVRTKIRQWEETNAVGDRVKLIMTSAWSRPFDPPLTQGREALIQGPVTRESLIPAFRAIHYI